MTSSTEASADAARPAVTSVVDGPVLEVTLDRPKANAIDAATSRELSAVFAEFRDTPELRVAIFSAAGDRFFSAGWDLNAAAAGEEFEADYGEGGFGGFGELPGLAKPVICAVNGMAVGGGFEIVLAADLVVAAETARFWLPEAGLGIIADTASVRLPRMLPPVVANEVLYAGRRLDAAEALRWGLVNAVVTGGDLMPETRALAKRVALSAPLSVAAISEIGRRTAHLGLPEAFESLRSGQLAAYEAMLASDDATEGPRAFTEGRPPRWQNR
ncbi:enoyl-CoA hydratase-related protein [Candidatus Poriferisodalis sp.]|uniref:enoyl-CoA hydratase-related protein n=1 Tax=Candidatus Poriferisodalis sp. TaxID=3101277 RepID=UPI003C6F0D85